MKFSLYVFTLSTFCLLSCSNTPTTEADKVAELPFFEMQAFFEEEINRLNELQPLVKKTVVINQESETKQIDAIDYEKELKVFSNSDINKMAWFDKYSIDSLYDNNQLQSISYQALDEMLKTQKINIAFQSNEVSQIEIENKTKSFIAASDQKLIYTPSSGYSIQTKQEMAVGKDKEIKIEVKF